MLTIEILHRLERIDQLIRLKATGSPKEFASRLHISESQLYKDLNLLRVTDPLGKVLKTIKIEGTEGTEEIDLVGWPAGLYWVYLMHRFTTTESPG